MKYLRLFAFTFMCGFLNAPAFAENFDGRVTVPASGSTVRISEENRFFKAIDACAMLANTGVIAIGFSPIGAVATRTGIPLNAGDCWHYEPKSTRGNLTNLKIDTTVNGEGVIYTAYD